MGISFIVFARNEDEDFILTLESLRDVSDRTESPIEIIAVNDGSSDETMSKLDQYFRNGFNVNLKYVIHQPPLGIAAALKAALNEVTFEKCIPLPGHFMFDADALTVLVNQAYCSEVVVGYRINLLRERPIAKYLAAMCLKFLFMLTITRKVRDPHGLIVYPTDLLRKVIDTNMRHENHIRALAYAVNQGVSITNFPIPIRSGHKKRSRLKGRPSAPRFLHLIVGVQELFASWKLLK